MGLKQSLSFIRKASRAAKFTPLINGLKRSLILLVNFPDYIEAEVSVGLHDLDIKVMHICKSLTIAPSNPGLNDNPSLFFYELKNLLQLLQKGYHLV